MYTRSQSDSDTYSNRIFRCFGSPPSPVALSSTLNLPKQERVGRIFTFTPGTFCQRISISLRSQHIVPPREISEIRSEKTKLDQLPVSSNDADRGTQLTAKCETWLSIDCF